MSLSMTRSLPPLKRGSFTHGWDLSCWTPEYSPHAGGSCIFQLNEPKLLWRFPSGLAHPYLLVKKPWPTRHWAIFSCITTRHPKSVYYRETCRKSCAKKRKKKRKRRNVVCNYNIYAELYVKIFSLIFSVFII